MNRSETITALAAAFAAFGAEVTNPPQNRTANVPTKAGGTYSYSYADLGDVVAHVRPVLAKHGLSITQELEVKPDRVEVTTFILHKTGEYMAYKPLALPAPEQHTPQGYGGVITYARRYSLMAALGLASDADDDAAAASGRQAATQKTAAPRTAANGRKVTDKQMGKIHAIAKEAGVTDDQLHKGAKRDYSVDSLKDLTTKQASELIDKLGKLPPAPPPEPEHDPDDDIGFDDEPVPGMDAEEARKSWERPPKEQEGLL